MGLIKEKNFVKNKETGDIVNVLDILYISGFKLNGLEYAPVRIYLDSTPYWLEVDFNSQFLWDICNTLGYSFGNNYYFIQGIQYKEVINLAKVSFIRQEEGQRERQEASAFFPNNPKIIISEYLHSAIFKEIDND